MHNPQNTHFRDDELLGYAPLVRLQAYQCMRFTKIAIKEWRSLLRIYAAFLKTKVSGGDIFRFRYLVSPPMAEEFPEDDWVDWDGDENPDDDDDDLW